MKAPRRIQAFRALGVAAATVLAVVAAVYSDRSPLIGGAATGLAWLIGKLLGVPLEGVLDAALTAMRPERRVEITRHAVQSLPPQQQQQLIDFVGSLRPPPPPESEK